MMTKHICIAIVLIAGLFPIPGICGDDPGAFEKIRKSAASVTTVTGDFIQERHSAMLEKPLVSKGRFCYQKPDKLRWEIVEPKVFGFSVNGKKAKRWKGDARRSQTFRITDSPFIKVFTEQFFLWASADFKQLEKNYRITVLQDDPPIMLIFPFDTKLGEYLEHIRFEFDTGAAYVRAVEVREKGGDYTRIVFENTVLNALPAEALF